MKLHITKPSLVAWDEIDLEKTREHNEYFDEECYEHEMKPLVLKNFQVDVNKHGQIGFRFDSPNHKYMKIEHSSWNLWDDNVAEGEEPTKYSTVVVRLESHEKVTLKDEDLTFPFPLWRAEIKFTPTDDREEERIGHANLSVMPLKYAYEVLFVPWDDHDIVLDEPDEEAMDYDMIYDFDMKVREET